MKILYREYRFSYVDWLFSLRNENLYCSLARSLFHTQDKEAGVIYDYEISTLHTYCSWCQEFNKIPATLYLQGFFPLVFYQLKCFFTWLTISYRCTWHSSCFPSRLSSVMCGVPRAAVSRFCWWYMNSSSAAACYELLQCLSTGGKQMRLTQGSSAPSGQDTADHAPPVPHQCSTIAALYQNHEAKTHSSLFPPAVLPSGW